MVDSWKTNTVARDASRSSALVARDAFKRRLAGRCFRCLNPDDKVAQCRDPICCLICRGSCHFARSCTARRRQPISASLRSRLTFPPESIHSRIAFPPLRHPSTANPPPTSSTSPPPAKAAMMAYAPSQATHHSALSHVAILDTENMTREADRLLSHAAVPSAPQDVYCSSTPEVAYALSHQLHVLRHNIMVTCHKPGVFVVEFRLAPECHTGMEDMEPMDRAAAPQGGGGERLPSPCC